jgi:hypothetical protein
VKKRSEILAPLTKLTSTQTPWKWTDKQPNAFNTMKKIMARKPFWLTQISKYLLKYTLLDEHENSNKENLRNREPGCIYMIEYANRVAHFSFITQVERQLCIVN